MAYTVVKGDTLSGIAGKLGVSLAALEAANPQIKNYNSIAVGQSINAPGGGTAAAAAPAASSGFSVDDAMSAYGYVYTLANAIPDLKTQLTLAIQNKWTPDRLTAAVESTDWWKQNADTVRNLVTAQYTDPATYTQNLANAKNLITLKAQALGRTIDDATATNLALQTLTTNASWDDQRLSQLVANNTAIGRGDSGGLLGSAATMEDHMTTVAQNYGVAYTSAWLDQWVNDVQSGRNTLDSFESVARARAKAAFPQFAAQIDAGMTVRDIADPYISTYAKTLEVPETQVTLNDPAIQKALSQTGSDGATQTSMPLWQFARTLKADPRYDKTDQAKSDAATTLAQVGHDFGFLGA